MGLALGSSPCLGLAQPQHRAKSRRGLLFGRERTVSALRSIDAAADVDHVAAFLRLRTRVLAAVAAGVEGAPRARTYSILKAQASLF